MLLGISVPARSKLSGVLDVFRDYPSEGIWYIGLLLLDPYVRSAGLGAKIVEELASDATRSGARELQLNVVEQNVAAHAIWTRHGFVELRRWRQHFGARESVFIRMSRRL
jgi:RimJ/RimL family protein N-acetyltransferase